jgi:hypothetical protein
VNGFDLVVPTVGRPSLVRLWSALASQAGPLPQQVVLVDDRSAPRDPPSLPHDPRWRAITTVVGSGGRGPAAARNAGWVLGHAPWVAFLDDDVVPDASWLVDLAADLAAAAPAVAASQGSITVPMPADRRPSDWERDVGGLERAHAATADIAYRRAVLAALGGFDERFPAAYREDADLALRARDLGWTIERGRRGVVHPVGPRRRGVSIRRQRGNADDALMRDRHGRDWRAAARAGRGRLPVHLLTTLAWVVALGALVFGRRRVSVPAAAVGTALTGQFALSRIAPGPRDPAEIAEMTLTSIAIPPVAVAHRVRGELAVRRAARRRMRPDRPAALPLGRGAGASAR